MNKPWLLWEKPIGRLSMERVQKIIDRISTSKHAEQLVDLKDVMIDESKPASERIRRYIEQIGDPYHFKVGEMKVEVCFAEGDEPLQQLMEKLVLANLGR